MGKKILDHVYAWENEGHLVNQNAFSSKKECAKAIGNYLGKPVLMVNVKSPLFDRLCRKRLNELLKGQK
jgi:hypothetical protein